MALRSRNYPHNDLLNLSHYNLGVINEKVENGVSDAIALDCKNFLIALAFTIEALMNLVGSKKVRGWKERDSYYKKMKNMCKAIGYPYNNESDLFCTLDKIKKLEMDWLMESPLNAP
jgi:glycyl-tRNA synthetase alpha subunit